MSGWLETILSNAAISAVAAALLLPLSRYTRLKNHPALRQALWMLVLLKLLTPPLFAPSWLRIEWPASSSSIAVAPVVHDAVAFDSADLIVERNEVHLETTWAADNASQAIDDEPFVAVSHETPPLLGLADHWPLALLSLSLVVSLILVARTAHGARKLRRLIRLAAEAPEEHRQALAEAAARLRLSDTPRLVLADGRFSPFLWAAPGRAAIVLPKALVGEFSFEQLKFVLAHELAHYKRGDRWANLFGALVCRLFWFHPAAWLAAREIRAAQESCCDALVVECFADTSRARRRYADTLLAALEFIDRSPTPTAKPALAPWASALGEAPTLKRRFEMIASTRMTHRWSYAALGALLLCCAALPAGLTFGQADVAPPGEAINSDAGISAPIPAPPAVDIPAFAQAQIVETTEPATPLPEGAPAVVESQIVEGQLKPEPSLLTFDSGVPYRIVMQNGKEIVGEVVKQSPQWKVVKLAGGDETITINVDHVQSFQREQMRKTKKAYAHRKVKAADLAAENERLAADRVDAQGVVEGDPDNDGKIDFLLSQAKREKDMALYAQQLAQAQAALAEQSQAMKQKMAAEADLRVQEMKEKFAAHAAEQEAIRAKLEAVGPVLNEMKEQLAVKEKELDEARRIIAELKKELAAQNDKAARP